MAKAGGQKFEMLNETTIAEIRELFTLFDKNSDGYVNTTELGTIIRALNMNPSESDVSEMMKDVDSSNSGSFDQNSLISLVARRGKTVETLDEMIEALRLFGENNGDAKDKDKEIVKMSVESFKYSMTTIGEKMLDHQIEEILTDSELVYDEYIMIEEFAKYLLSR